MSETHLTDEVQDFEINCANYNVRCDSHSKCTRGVLVYVRQNLNYKIMCNTNIDKNLWICR